ncbi:MAG: hypothetical protein ACLPRE_01100 [Limisphaerales bacterium]
MKIYHTTIPNGSLDPTPAHDTNVYQELVHVVFLPQYGGASHG